MGSMNVALVAFSLSCINSCVDVEAYRGAIAFSSLKSADSAEDWNKPSYPNYDYDPYTYDKWLYRNQTDPYRPPPSLHVTARPSGKHSHASGKPKSKAAGLSVGGSRTYLERDDDGILSYSIGKDGSAGIGYSAEGHNIAIGYGGKKGGAVGIAIGGKDGAALGSGGENVDVDEIVKIVLGTKLGKRKKKKKGKKSFKHSGKGRRSEVKEKEETDYADDEDYYYEYYDDDKTGSGRRRKTPERKRKH